MGIEPTTSLLQGVSSAPELQLLNILLLISRWRGWNSFFTFLGWKLVETRNAVLLCLDQFHSLPITCCPWGTYKSFRQHWNWIRIAGAEGFPLPQSLLGNKSDFRIHNSGKHVVGGLSCSPVVDNRPHEEEAIGLNPAQILGFYSLLVLSVACHFTGPMQSCHSSEYPRRKNISLLKLGQNLASAFAILTKSKRLIRIQLKWQIRFLTVSENSSKKVFFFLF